MEKANICIIVAGYNRPKAIERLLKSISEADYGGDTVDLLISLDKGESQSEIINISEEFVWANGNKKIRAFKERLGLKKHIIKCGEVVEEYDAVVVLEDDLSVSKDFYSYVKQAVAFYMDEDRIAGISLYKHSMNVGTADFFEPEYNGYDAFFIQYAQSWGQCWTKKMWVRFASWLNQNDNYFFDNSNNTKLNLIPDNVMAWGKQSWLKYNVAYAIVNNLYFVYPYHALSTNHAETGQHNILTSSAYEVALSNGKKTYSFPKFEEAVKYDGFFERNDYVIPGLSDKRIILDLYGAKKEPFEGDILITTRCYPYRVINKWRMRWRPQEVNCLYQEDGNDIYVYDLQSVSTEKPELRHVFNRTQYDLRALSLKKIILFCCDGIKKQVFGKVKHAKK